MDRLVIIPEEGDWTISLQNRFRRIAGEIRCSNLTSVIPDLSFQMCQQFWQSSGVMILWGKEFSDFRAAWSNPGLNYRDELSASGNEGLIATVFNSGNAMTISATEPSSESAGSSSSSESSASWTNLRECAGRSPHALGAVPVSVFGSNIGVLSAVAFSREDEPLKMDTLGILAMGMARFAELRISRLCLGMDGEL